MVDNISSLAGKFLLSTPRMPDPRFARHVIYICSHSAEGAMGVAVNRIDASISIAEVLRESALPVPVKPLPPIHIGGPVDQESAFILYLSDYWTENKLDVSDTIALTRETKVLEDISKGQGPSNYLFILGYTGWGPGQLEAELVSQGWLALPASDDIIFHTANEEKWRAAALLYNIDIATFEDHIGYA